MRGIARAVAISGMFDLVTTESRASASFVCHSLRQLSPSWQPVLICRLGKAVTDGGAYLCSVAWGRATICPMPKAVHFYMDDSGTRTIDHEPTPFDANQPDHFALGGVLVLEEDEDAVRAAHHELCSRWKIDYSLHSVDIRHGSHKFSWVRRESPEYKPFMRDLTKMLTSAPVTALACVMDRPGYDRRYRDSYPRSLWHLCRTVFAVAVERAAKYARDLGRPLRVYPEKSAKDDERRIKAYYASLITEGLPFDAAKSRVYAPLSSHEFNETLIELRFKAKSSPPMQFADLYLWPIAMHRYGRGGRPYAAFVDASRLIEARFGKDQIAARATKYSCFELVDQAAKNNKGPDSHPSL